jgi:capsular exopolysaccharide synthesis family protein
MSRIQEILKKAEREGNVQRTRAVTEPVQPVATRGVGPALVDRVESPPASRVDAPALSFAEGAPVAMHPANLTVRRVEGTLDARLVAARAPHSIAAEQYRSLRTRVTRAEHGRAVRAIIVTSPNKGDGKSLTAANLALTMAQELQQRVLLLDADLRRPSIHRLVGISDTPGLTDVLMGGVGLDDALVTLADHRLSVLPAGMIPSNPAELLGSVGMRRVLDTLRTRFDRILIDMPPIAPLADVAVASSMADGVLMIVRAGVTPKPAIERALSGLDPSKVLGLVLNDAGTSSAAYGGYDGYGYVAG